MNGAGKSKSATQQSHINCVRHYQNSICLRYESSALRSFIKDLYTTQRFITSLLSALPKDAQQIFNPVRLSQSYTACAAPSIRRGRDKFM